MALRFNGQLPTSTTGSYSAFAGRLVGTASGVTIQTGMLPLWGTRRNQTAAFGNRSAQPDGTNHPVAWLMPLQSGRISARSCEVVFTVGGSGTLGRPIIGSSSITFVVSPAQLNLVVSAIGSTSVTFTTTGGLAGALNATGSTTVTVTVNAATIGAIVNLIGATPITFSNSGTIRATGNLAGAITPFTELSPENLAAAVWNAIAAEYNIVDTMGYQLNNSGGGGGGGATAAQIWAYASRTLTASPGPTAAAIASQVRTELTTELGRIDASVSSRAEEATAQEAVDAAKLAAALSA